MIENRRIRFSSIDGLRRHDLPLAAEVWLEDLKSQIWVTRGILKLATHCVRYMSDPSPDLETFSRVERSVQLAARQVGEALRIMQMYGGRHEET